MELPASVLPGTGGVVLPDLFIQFIRVKGFSFICARKISTSSSVSVWIAFIKDG
jgi:hypothetical protein